MLSKKPPKSTYLIIFVLMLLIASLACGGSTTDELEEAAKPAATEVKEEPAAAAAEEEGQEEAQKEAPPTAEEAEADPEPTEDPPTATPEPTKVPPTVTPEPEPIAVAKFGFSQDDREVAYAFLVENPNMGLAFDSSQYQIAAFDESGAVVDTDSGYLTVLLPGQTLGVASSMYVEEGTMVSTIDVQLNAGDAEASEQIPSFTVDNINYFEDDYFPSVTALVTSPYNRDLEDVRVSAILYDPAGEIIGGGATYISFINANDSMGVDMGVTAVGEIGSIELYPSISGLTFFGSDVEIPSDGVDINLANFGFGHDGSSAGIGLVVENPNENYSVEGSQYHVTAFSADGTVLGTDEGYITMLLPGETLGIGIDMYPEGEDPIDNIIAQVLAGSFVESEPIPTFSADNVSYIPDAYFSKVTGLILSPYNSDITDVKVAAILYDAAGNIIGGGYTYLDFVPANSQAAVEVSVTSDGAPETMELYASVTSLSDIE